MTTGAMSATDSPLHSVRQAEAEAARMVASARRQAEAILSAAAAEAETMVAQGREDGRREGERLCAERIASAQAQADALVAAARLGEEERRQRCRPLLDVIAGYLVDLVLGSDGGNQP